MTWTNADGLEVLMHGEQGEVKTNGTTVTSVTNQLVYEIADATLLGTAAVDPKANDSFIPAGAYITKAYLIVETAFTSAGLATLTLGTQTSAGADIDADCIDAAIALTPLNTAGKVVVSDGAQVGGAITVGAANAYISAVYGTAAFTAGSGKLVIEYVEV